MTPHELIGTYGYLLLFFGTLLEGETVLIAAGFAAHRGLLDLPWVIFLAFLGGLAGDESYFFLGRLKGKLFLEKHPGWSSRAHKVETLLERYHTLVIVGFRFMYGLRTVTPFVIGLSAIPTKRFLVLNAIGGFVWACLVGLAGFLFGAVVETLFGDVRRYDHWIILGLLCAGLVGWAAHFVTTRRRMSPKG